MHSIKKDKAPHFRILVHNEGLLSKVIPAQNLIQLSILKQSYNPFVSQQADDEADFKSCMIRDQPVGSGSNTHLSDLFQAAAAKQSHVLDEIQSQKSEVQQDDYQECES